VSNEQKEEKRNKTKENLQCVFNQPICRLCAWPPSVGDHARRCERPLAIVVVIVANFKLFVPSIACAFDAGLLT
jgi:hypothetical protein